MKRLSKLITPCSERDFFINHWRKNILHSKSNKKYFESLFSVDELSELMNTHSYSLDVPEIRVSTDDNDITLDDIVEYSDYYVSWNENKRKINPHKIIRLLASGASLIFSDISEYNKKLQAFTHSLQEELKAQTSMTAFFSSPKKRALEPHYDLQDIFSIQIAGHKQWTFFDHVLNPTRFIKQQEPLSISSKVELSPGEVLYIPNGLWHSVIATGPRHSLSLNIGVTSKTKLDILTHFLEDIIYPSTANEQYFAEPIPLINEYIDKKNELNNDIKTTKQKILEKINSVSTEEIDSLIKNLYDYKHQRSYTSTYNFPFDLNNLEDQNNKTSN